jgi:hypothetical protein
MSEKGSESDIEARRFNVAEVPEAGVMAALFWRDWLVPRG